MKVCLNKFITNYKSINYYCKLFLEQISRLHMILKPFMLRRIKKDVENELSDKIEIMVYCPLTTRQKLLYMALKKKIRIEDLLQISGVGGDGHIVDKNFTSNLMNLVMQFRKVIFYYFSLYSLLILHLFF